MFIIATPHYSSWRGRVVKWGGNDPKTIEAIQAVIVRDGVAKASKRLTERSSWNCIDPNQEKEMSAYLNPDRFLPVEGYGLAYPEPAIEEDWVGSKDEYCGADACLTLTDNGLMVYVWNDGWNLKSTYTYAEQDEAA